MGEARSLGLIGAVEIVSRKGDKTYGVYEFMYCIDGSAPLTSLDGTAVTVHAGEAVTIPHDRQGAWDTKGYTKFLRSTRSRVMSTNRGLCWGRWGVVNLALSSAG